MGTHFPNRYSSIVNLSTLFFIDLDETNFSMIMNILMLET